MAKYQPKPTIESVAARRNQTLAQLLTDWAVTSVDDLTKRCKREGVTMPTDFTFVASDATAKDDVPHVNLPVTVKEKTVVKNALVELPKKSEELPAKKIVKGKLTPDEPVAGVEHVRVDQGPAAGPKDPT